MKNIIGRSFFAIMILGGVSTISINNAQAAGAVKGDSVSMCTVKLEGSYEAVVVLDHLTGKLTGLVVNPNNGKFFGRYTYASVNKDLKVRKTKKPKFLLIAGDVSLRNAGGGQFAGGVVYVLEENSGMIAAYGLKWSPAVKNNSQGFTAQFLPFAKEIFRKAPRGRK